MENIDRFIIAHDRSYEIALSEIKNGMKITHWMWYIFPQFKGLGFSPMSVRYAINSLDEAKAYLQNELLRSHLIEISSVLLNLKENNPTKIFGSPDDLKLNSSMTLFNYVEPDNEILEGVINKYYNGVKDEKTLNLIHNMHKK